MVEKGIMACQANNNKEKKNENKIEFKSSTYKYGCKKF